MSFSLRVVFTGILGLVPNRPFAQNPTQIWVVAPNGEIDPGQKRNGADGDPLARHRAFIKVDLANVLGADTDTLKLGGIHLDGIWYMLGQEFRMETSEYLGGISVSSLASLASLPDVAPDYSQVDPEAIQGSSPKIPATFRLNKGRLRCRNQKGP